MQNWCVKLKRNRLSYWILIPGTILTLIQIEYLSNNFYFSTFSYHCYALESDVIDREPFSAKCLYFVNQKFMFRTFFHMNSEHTLCDTIY